MIAKIDAEQLQAKVSKVEAGNQCHDKTVCNNDNRKTVFLKVLQEPPKGLGGSLWCTYGGNQIFRSE